VSAAQVRKWLFALTLPQIAFVNPRPDSRSIRMASFGVFPCKGLRISERERGLSAPPAVNHRGVNDPSELNLVPARRRSGGPIHAVQFITMIAR
jgi:hypothetical protein